MYGIKNPLASVGVWGSIIALIAGITGLSIGFDVDTGDFHINLYQLGGALSGIGLVGGSLTSLWGRLTATKLLTTAKNRVR